MIVRHATLLARCFAGSPCRRFLAPLASSRARRIRCLICRLLFAGFRLRLVQRSFGFSMDCFGGFFCFLAHSLSGFLRLSADGLGSLLGFFSNGFCGFLGLFARSFESVLNRLPCFFRSLLSVFQCSFLREGNKRRGHSQSNNKARYFHACLLFIYAPCSPVYRKRMRCPDRAHRAASTRRHHSTQSDYIALQQMRS